MVFPLHFTLMVLAMHCALLDNLYNTCTCIYIKNLKLHKKMHKLAILKKSSISFFKFSRRFNPCNQLEFRIPCNISGCSPYVSPSWMPCTLHVHVYIKNLKLHMKMHKLAILKKL